MSDIEKSRKIIWADNAYLLGSKIPGNRYELQDSALAVYSGIFNKKVQIFPLYTIERTESKIGFIDSIFRCGKIFLYIRGMRETAFIMRVKNPNDILELLAEQQRTEKNNFLRKKKKNAKK